MAVDSVELRRFIDEYVARLRQLVRVDCVYLFGSYAKGTPRERSDVDLAVVSPDFGESLFQDVRALAAGRWDPRSRICPLPFPRREWEELPEGSFLREVIRTGREVYPPALREGTDLGPVTSEGGRQDG
jgi:hypothetical protein